MIVTRQRIRRGRRRRSASPAATAGACVRPRGRVGRRASALSRSALDALPRLGMRTPSDRLRERTSRARPASRAVGRASGPTSGSNGAICQCSVPSVVRSVASPSDSPRIARSISRRSLAGAQVDRVHPHRRPAAWRRTAGRRRTSRRSSAPAAARAVQPLDRAQDLPPGRASRVRASKSRRSVCRRSEHTEPACVPDRAVERIRACRVGLLDVARASSMLDVERSRARPASTLPRRRPRGDRSIGASRAAVVAAVRGAGAVALERASETGDALGAVVGQVADVVVARRTALDVEAWQRSCSVLAALARGGGW